LIALVAVCAMVVLAVVAAVMTGRDAGQPVGTSPPTLGRPPSDGQDGPPTTTSATSVPDTPTVEQELADCEARVAAAGLQVSFVPATSMVQGEAHEVGAVVALRGTPIGPPAGAGSSPTTLVPYDAGRCLLSAGLRGAGFAVDPPDADEQSFVDADQLSWSWQVTPHSSGRLQLRLVITPVILSGGGVAAIRGAEHPFTAHIVVTAAPDLRSWWDKLNGVFAAPLPAAMLSVLLAGVSATGIATWVRSHRRRRRPQDDFEGVL
jgi:hypothetical protein